MRKQIIITVCSALVIIAAVALAWWWLFGNSQISPSQSIGTFGSAQNNPTANTNPSAGGGLTNVPSQVAQNSSSGSISPSSSVPNQSSSPNTGRGSGTESITITGGTATGVVGVPGVTWISAPQVSLSNGNSSNSGSGSTVGTVFNPPGTSPLSTGGPGVIPPLPSGGSPSGASSVTIGGSTGQGSGSSGSGLGAALGGAAISAGVSCVLPALAGLIGGSFSLALAGQTLTQTGGQAPSGYPVTDTATHLGELGNNITNAASAVSTNLGLAINISNLIRDDTLNCIARTIAHSMLQQIAQSTVSWINSGFNGSPSFVQNYDQFFTNVADQAAGQFIQGSSLSFLCSPFQLQVKIAIAQSYANQGAQSCTLSSITNNIQGFMNGDFSSGGWPGFLSFTTTPTNNPYGAFVAGQVGLTSAVANAQGKQAFDLQLSGGFLSIKQQTNCKTVVTDSPPSASNSTSVTQIDTGGNGNAYRVCDQTIVTPGTAIAQALDQTLGINTQSLETAKYFDEIIGALVSQLMQNIAYSGLFNLSGSGSNGTAPSYNITAAPSSPAQQQDVLQNIPQFQQSAQSLLTIENQNIGNVQSSIQQAQALDQCWISKEASSTSSNLSSSKQSQAQQSASSTESTIASLQQQLATYQSMVTAANNSLTLLAQYETRAQTATDQTTIDSLTSDFATAVANHSFIIDSDVANAQEDQIKLNTDLSQTNQSIASGMAQCNAL